MISLDSYISFAFTNIRETILKHLRQSLGGKDEIFQLHVTCRRGQATSMLLDYYTPVGGGGIAVR